MFGQGFMALYSSLLLMNVGGSCALHPAPSVEIVLNIEKPVLNVRLSRSQIEEMTMDMDGTKSPYKNFKKNQYIGSGMYVTFGKGGVTLPKAELNAETTLERVSSDDVMESCYALAMKITIDASSEVYIANSYKPGTCEYKAIMRHENRHVVTEHRVLRYYKKLMEEELSKAAADFIEEQGGRAIPFETADATLAAYTAHMNGSVNDLWDRMGRDAMKLQQQLDTHEEYSKVRKECAYMNKYRFLSSRKKDN